MQVQIKDEILKKIYFYLTVLSIKFYFIFFFNIFLNLLDFYY